MGRLRPINIILFLSTILTTIFCGTMLFETVPMGVLFSFTIMSILLIHEMGHYTKARKHDLDVTLPYFLPVPFSIGTLGAFIKMRQTAPNRNVLMDVGASGPLYGFVISIIAVAIGMYIAPVLETKSVIWGGVSLGDSALYAIMAYLIKGSPSAYLELNPILFAGWLGLFLTMLNLLPTGQLDGGHVVYAMFGKSKHYHQGMPIFFKLLIIWGIISTLCYQVVTWLFFGLFIAYMSSSGDYRKDSVMRLIILFSFLTSMFTNSFHFMVGAGIVALFLLRKAGIHPPLDNEMIDLTTGNRIIGWVCSMIFILTFTPLPFKFF